MIHLKVMIDTFWCFYASQCTYNQLIWVSVRYYNSDSHFHRWTM